MTDYEFILAQCWKYHYSKWNDEELRRCVKERYGDSGYSGYQWKKTTRR